MERPEEDTEYLISEADARRLLEPHHGALAEIVRESHGLWADHVGPLFQRPLDRTRAQVVSNAFYERAMSRFDGVDDVRWIENHERLLLVCGNKLVLRFKRLDYCKRTRNYPTHASDRMDSQRQTSIPTIEKFPRVILGYTLEGVTHGLSGIHVVFRKSNHMLWAYPIDGGAAGSLPLPFDRSPPNEPDFEFREREEGEAEGLDAGKTNE
jgi:hypothetical protein